DSCVEFFIAFDDDSSYYNLEFNCTGTCLAGYGTGRGEKRKLLPASVIRNIRQQSLVKTGNPDISWELTLLIPLSVFCHHRFVSLKNQDCRVNFYKCGDDLPQPHYLCWSPIQAPAPDFHRPEFFAPARFQFSESNHRVLSHNL